MTDEQSAAFLKRLWELQAVAGLKNSHLARELGYSAAYIHLLKKGERGKQLSMNFAMAAAKRFPELAVFLLAAVVPVVSDRATIGNPAKTQDTENPPAR